MSTLLQGLWEDQQLQGEGALWTHYLDKCSWEIHLGRWIGKRKGQLIFSSPEPCSCRLTGIPIGWLEITASFIRPFFFFCATIGKITFWKFRKHFPPKWVAAWRVWIKAKVLSAAWASVPYLQKLPQHCQNPPPKKTRGLINLRKWLPRQRQTESSLREEERWKEALKKKKVFNQRDLIEDDLHNTLGCHLRIAFFTLSFQLLSFTVSSNKACWSASTPWEHSAVFGELHVPEAPHAWFNVLCKCQ